MIWTIISIIILLTAFSIIGLLIYSKISGSQISETYDIEYNNPEESVRKRLAPYAKKWSDRINKDLLIGYRTKKGIVTRSQKYDTPIDSIQDPTEKNDQQQEFKKDIEKNIENSKMPEDLKDSALKRLESGDIPNRILIVKDSRFSRKKDLILINESDVLSENKNRIVLRKDIQLMPYSNSENPTVWYSDNIQIKQSLKTVNDQELAYNLLGETKRKLEIIRDLDIKHSQRKDELETEKELLEEMNQKGSASNYNYN